MNDFLFLKTKKILFAEDDAIARGQISSILEMLFAQVLIASDGEEALRLYEEESPDLILADIKMPRRDGLSLVQRIRKDDYVTPVILMTSFAEQDLIINAANLSVDGYLVKPVELDKLTSALSRAFKRLPKKDMLMTLAHNLYYNNATKELYLNGTSVILGVKEHELLNLFINQRGKTVTKDEIIQTLWPLDPICDSALKNMILRLRKKLGNDIIISVRGIGYRIDTRDPSKNRLA